MKNIEIEFKNPIDEKTYNELINKYKLENNIFLQTNFYFDSNDKKLTNDKIVLRIRFKEPNRYKVTLKTNTKNGSLEEHVFLNEEKATSMIKNGFNVEEFFEIKLPVKMFGKLDNYRVSMPYKDGELFVDKISYFNEIDYEIEYEVDNYEQGEKDFQQFLKDHNIKEAPFTRKSSRIFNYND